MKFTENVYKYEATKVTEGIFDILKIFKMAAIFRPKMAILVPKFRKKHLVGIKGIGGGPGKKIDISFRLLHVIPLSF